MFILDYYTQSIFHMKTLRLVTIIHNMLNVQKIKRKIQKRNKNSSFFRENWVEAVKFITDSAKNEYKIAPSFNTNNL